MLQHYLSAKNTHILVKTYGSAIGVSGNRLCSPLLVDWERNKHSPEDTLIAVSPPRGKGRALLSIKMPKTTKSLMITSH